MKYEAVIQESERFVEALVNLVAMEHFQDFDEKKGRFNPKVLLPSSGLISFKRPNPQ